MALPPVDVRKVPLLWSGLFHRAGYAGSKTRRYRHCAPTERVTVGNHYVCIHLSIGIGIHYVCILLSIVIGTQNVFYPSVDWEGMAIAP